MTILMFLQTNLHVTRRLGGPHTTISVLSSHIVFRVDNNESLKLRKNRKKKKPTFFATANE